MGSEKFLLVSTNVLPTVFQGVVYAKELLATGQAANITKAIQMAGISRSAFYKYKDFVFKYTDSENNYLNLKAQLSDKAGVFSALTTALSKFNVNLVTVNQNTPVNGAADVSLTVDINNLTVSLEELIKTLSKIDGVISIKTISGGKYD